MTDTLATIQRNLKAPKDKKNDFGGYSYRNAETILHRFKEVAPDGVSLTMSDDVRLVGDHLFLVATVTLQEAGQPIATATGAAMHAIDKKGMDKAQITGACSSYARKYALCGLFAIDDSADDPDAKDNRETFSAPQKLVTEGEAAILNDLAERAGTDRAGVFKAMKLEGNSWADTPAEWFKPFRRKMQAKLDQMEMEHDQAARGADNG
jgi:hypothetical protein